MNRLMKWPLLCGLLALSLAREAQCSDPLYQNDSIVSYPGTVSTPPDIAATNFVNNSIFTINYTTLNSVTGLFRTSDTANYTNTGAMSCNTGFGFENSSSVSGNVSPSANFYNQGSVNCGSGTAFTDIGGLLFFSVGQCLVNATNIVNPGVITASLDGLIQLDGKNVDLSRGSVNIGADPTGSSVFASGAGTFGLNTNLWFPSFDLTPTTAASAQFQLIPFFPQIMQITNSSAYFDVNNSDPSNTIYRVVFIQDTSAPNVSYNVYFGNAGILGNGGATIEWAGTFMDPASGSTVNSYLYLNNDYLESTATNIFFNNGVPDNLTFSSSDTPIPLGAPTAAGFLNIFPFGSVTNRYSYADAQLTASSVGTNTIPNGAITNLPGQIKINATDELNLANANIFGMNYMSLQSPHQFDGSSGAVIRAPYADINVGVTNGFLTVSNLMASSLSSWSGNVQCWSTRWLVGNNGITNDYRVMIVRSQVNPLNPTAIQDLTLHGTNSIVISDTFNVLRNFTADAQNLTLTTNETGQGANSFDGELNLGAPNTAWASSLPNLRNLTNNGAIRLQNFAQFLGTSNGMAITPALTATGMLSEVTGRTNVRTGNKIIIGTNKYVFVSKLTNSIANQVKIAAKFDGTMSNLIAAINRSAGAGTNYSTNTVAHPSVTAGVFSTNAHSFIVSAKIAGTAGNSIQTLASVSTTNITWNGYTTLHSGADAATNVTGVPVPYNNLVNSGLIIDQGSAISANYFQSSGTVSNGVGSFTLQSMNTILTNGALLAGGDISITTSSLLTSNLLIVAGKSLVLKTTNLITDTGVASGNYWTVGGAAGIGFSLPVKPLTGDLLGTTITNIAPTNKVVVNTWSAKDFGVSTAGYTNNQALGRLILSSYGTPPQNGQYYFTGTGTSNALYVDYLELQGQVTNFNNGSIPSVQINTNLVIYYAQAVANGVSVANKLNGLNNGHLRWVSNYVGNFSYTSIVYPDGTTNYFNAALAASDKLDSDGDGIKNNIDPTPFFVASQLNFSLTAVSNNPPVKVKLKWNSIPSSTSYIQFSSNLPPVWKTILTNVAPATVPPVGGWPITNSVQYSPTGAVTGFYRVWVSPAQ